MAKKSTKKKSSMNKTTKDRGVSPSLDATFWLTKKSSAAP